MIFVVQQHHAKKLHWDLRLEHKGVLKSWALPKEPPLHKGTKRLAIPTEDHPISYADFEGTIPEGMYGAGEVKIWDRGRYQAIEWKRDRIEVLMEGKKLKGKYVLIRMKNGNWLLFKV